MSISVDSKTIATAGMPEALTDRIVRCTSVFIYPDEDNTGAAYIVDSEDDTKKAPIPSTGIVLPVQDPRIIRVDVETNGETVHWTAV